MIDSSDLTFRQVFTKHMVDQSITQLWKNMHFILVPFLCKFSAKDWFIFWINEYHALFVWNTFFLQITLFYKQFCSNQYLLHLFSKVWGDPMTSYMKILSSYLERAADIHACLQYWVFCSIELWLLFYCLWSLHLSLSAWGISHFLTLFFSACVLLFSESLKWAGIGLVCWLHWVPFTAASRVAYTVPLHELPFPKGQLRNKLSPIPLLPCRCLLIAVKIDICKVTCNICSNRAFRLNLC